MEKFVKLDNILINVERLISVKYGPETQSPKLVQSEHYLALFDTGQVVMLEPEDGKGSNRAMSVPIYAYTIGRQDRHDF
jgi:hypothetical protein